MYKQTSFLHFYMQVHLFVQNSLILNTKQSYTDGFDNFDDENNLVILT